MTEALIVVDVQNEYETGALPIAYPPFDRALAAVTAAMDTAAERGVPVVVIQHDAPAGAPVFAPGTPSWELHSEVAKRRRDHLVHKHTASSFHGTDLGAWLAERGVTAVTLAGFMTQNCVFATAFDAVAAGLAVRVLADATGTPGLANDVGRVDARELQETLLTVLASNLATVSTTAEWAAGGAGVRSTFSASVARHAKG